VTAPCADRRYPGGVLSHVVFWDFDGTLAHRPGLWTGSLLEALGAVSPGHDVTAERLRPELSRGFPWHDPARAHPDLAGSDAWWGAMRQVFRSAYERVGVSCTVARHAAAAVREYYLDPLRWVVDPAAAPVLERLSAEGFRHIVLSNHVPELADLADVLGLGRHFAAVLTSAHTGYEKPNPAAFHHALAIAGQPERAWMVGDSPTADVAGAHAVGLPAVLVGAGSDTDLAAAAELILATTGSRI
jgi:putative hydrolase of the HAD superfamily